jgi:hypothetical protein
MSACKHGVACECMTEALALWRTDDLSTRVERIERTLSLLATNPWVPPYVRRTIRQAMQWSPADGA